MRTKGFLTLLCLANPQSKGSSGIETIKTAINQPNELP